MKRSDEKNFTKWCNQLNRYMIEKYALSIEFSGWDDDQLRRHYNDGDTPEETVPSATAQVLLGVTGSGKTFTMANVIQATQRPALILAPNKTLAAQLYGEFRSFFPDNAVEYFVSYYDYYQPEAYVPRTDTYIEKESSINEQIDRMRHSATRALLERDDVSWWSRPCRASTASATWRPTPP
jgi:hypothetical protein